MLEASTRKPRKSRVVFSVCSQGRYTRNPSLGINILSVDAANNSLIFVLLLRSDIFKNCLPVNTSTHYAPLAVKYHINVNGLRQVGTAHLRVCIVNLAIPIALNVSVANDGACVNMTVGR